MTFNPDTFPGVVPIFPLPGAVLFPQMGLPLHIFEPRYRQMTEDALQGDRLIAMALLKPGWESNYNGKPDVFPTIGIGSIVSEVRNENGTFNLMLYGVARARIVQEVDGPKLYRLARVDVLEDDPRGLTPDLVGPERMKLAELLRRLLPSASIGENVSYGSLIDLLAAVLLSDAAERQRILEELRVVARAELLAGFLQNNPAYKALTSPKPRIDMNRPNPN
jgi:hypothetical protein